MHVTLDGKLVDMEIDTGASVSLMPENVYTQLWPGRSLDYLKDPIGVVGSVSVCVQYQGQSAELELIVVKGEWT